MGNFKSFPGPKRNSLMHLTTLIDDIPTEQLQFSRKQDVKACVYEGIMYTDLDCATSWLHVKGWRAVSISEISLGRRSQKVPDLRVLLLCNLVRFMFSDWVVITHNTYVRIWRGNVEKDFFWRVSTYFDQIVSLWLLSFIVVVTFARRVNGRLNGLAHRPCQSEEFLNKILLSLLHSTVPMLTHSTCPSFQSHSGLFPFQSVAKKDSDD